MENRDFIEKNEELKPKDIYKEYAGYGILGEFVLERMKTRYENDDEFRQRVNNTLINYSQKQEPAIEALLLSELNKVLSKFLEKVNECLHIQKQ